MTRKFLFKLEYFCEKYKKPVDEYGLFIKIADYTKLQRMEYNRWVEYNVDCKKKLNIHTSTFKNT